jgi:diguanylate cyclase (GGDEF)-like protein/PAS domain S-box-containing protein
MPGQNTKSLPSNVIRLAGLTEPPRSRKQPPTAAHPPAGSADETLKALDYASHLAAILKSHAVMELALDGTMLWANTRFLNALGYRLSEIQGRHHSMIVEPGLRESPEYEKFWTALRAGRPQVAQYRRIGKAGRAIWLQASYNPVLDEAGLPVKILKLATDITAKKRQAEDFKSQVCAIARSQAVIEFDLNGTILTANQRFLDMMGYRLDEIAGHHHSIFVDRLTRNSDAYAAFWDNLRRGLHQTAEFRRIDRQGRDVWLQASYTPVIGADHLPVKIIKYAMDVTARKRQADEYESQMLAIHKSQAIVEFTLDGTVISANQHFLTATGYTLAEIVGEKHSIFVEPALRDGSDYRRFWAELRRGRYFTGEYRRIGKNGKPIWFQASYNPILDHDGKPIKIIKFATDVTGWKLKAASAEVDALTGLPNRLLLNDRLTQAITAARRRRTELAVLFLDLDGFKHVNDSLGHLIGDKLLQAVASRLTACVRASDTVSRQGGDEFVILIPDLHAPEDAAVAAQKIMTGITDGFVIDHHELHVTTSIGVSIFPHDGTGAATLLKNADTAMYEAKKNGRNAYRFFESSMNAKASERQSISEHLRNAAGRGEFSLVYQPKIDLASAAIIGAEALLRWTHPAHGAIGPAEFIPVAENAGMIRDVGTWVLREACRQLRQWRSAGLVPPRLSINVSGLEFNHDDFLERTIEILQDTGTPAAALEFELTETVLMKNPAFIAPILSKLRQLGIQISLDDFGTGYSSLSYLTKFPIDTLKIDKSFVADLAPGKEAVIVAAIISIARSLNMRVIAEGVETGAHLSALRDLNCDEAQGHYFSAPLPPDAFGTLLRSDIPIR